MTVKRTAHVHAQPYALGGDRQRRQVYPRIERPGRMIAEKNRVESQRLSEAPCRQQMNRWFGWCVDRKDMQRESNVVAMLLDPWCGGPHASHCYADNGYKRQNGCAMGRLSAPRQRRARRRPLQICVERSIVVARDQHPQCNMKSIRPKGNGAI
jgi:hypothetical protein